MNKIERALTTLQDLLDNSIFTSRIDFALEVAIESLREKAEREKGCAFCNTRAHRILVNALYCPRCGRRLEV